MGICSDQVLRDPNWAHLVDEGSLIYFGGFLSADGRAVSKVSCKIGAASGDSKKLQEMWGHAGINRKRKFELVHALAVSRLAYGLTLWQAAGVPRVSEQVLHDQLRFLGRVARAPSQDAMRIGFLNGGVQPLTGCHTRRVGRPRREWTTQVLKAGAEKLGGVARMEHLVWQVRGRLGSRAEESVQIELACMYHIFLIRIW